MREKVNFSVERIFDVLSEIFAGVNKSRKHLVVKYAYYRYVEPTGPTGPQRDIEINRMGRVMNSLKSELKLQVARKRSCPVIYCHGFWAFIAFYWTFTWDFKRRLCEKRVHLELKH